LRDENLVTGHDMISQMTDALVPARDLLSSILSTTSHLSSRLPTHPRLCWTLWPTLADLQPSHRVTPYAQSLHQPECWPNNIYLLDPNHLARLPTTGSSTFVTVFLPCVSEIDLSLPFPTTSLLSVSATG